MQRLFEKKLFDWKKIRNEETFNGCWCKTDWENLYN